MSNTAAAVVNFSLQAYKMYGGESQKEFDKYCLQNVDWAVWSECLNGHAAN